MLELRRHSINRWTNEEWFCCGFISLKSPKTLHLQAEKAVAGLELCVHSQLGLCDTESPWNRRCCLSSPSPSLSSADQAQLPPSLAPGCWFFKKETSALSSGWWWLVSDCRSGWWMTDRQGVKNAFSQGEGKKIRHLKFTLFLRWFRESRCVWNFYPFLF